MEVMNGITIRIQNNQQCFSVVVFPASGPGWWRKGASQLWRRQNSRISHDINMAQHTSLIWQFQQSQSQDPAQRFVSRSRFKMPRASRCSWETEREASSDSWSNNGLSDIRLNGRVYPSLGRGRARAKVTTINYPSISVSLGQLMMISGWWHGL